MWREYNIFVVNKNILTKNDYFVYGHFFIVLSQTLYHFLIHIILCRRRVCYQKYCHTTFCLQ